MGARGTKSRDETEALRLVIPKPSVMSLPRGTPKAVRDIFDETVSSFPVDHFSGCDKQMLAAYCYAAVQANELAKVLANEGAIIETKDGARKVHPAVNGYSTAVGSMTGLASKLRICPSARVRSDAADNRPIPAASPSAKRPWLTKKK